MKKLPPPAMPAESVLVEKLTSIMAEGPILYSASADLNQEFSDRLTLKCMDSDTVLEPNRSPHFLEDVLIYERRESKSASTSPEAPCPSAESEIGSSAPLSPTDSGIGSPAHLTSAGSGIGSPVHLISASSGIGSPAHLTSTGSEISSPVHLISASSGIGSPAHLTFPAGLPPTGSVIRFQAGLPHTGSGLPPTVSGLPQVGSGLPPTGSVIGCPAHLPSSYGSRIASSRRACLPPPGRINFSSRLPPAHSAHLSPAYTGINSPGCWSPQEIAANQTADSRIFTPGFVACTPTPSSIHPGFKALNGCGAPRHSIRKFSPPIAGNYPMTGTTMEPEEDNESRHYSDRETMAVEVALDLSTGSKADNSSRGSSSRAPVSVQNPNNELASPVHCQTPEVPHTTAPATSFYPVISTSLDAPANFMPRKANWQVTTLPPSPPTPPLPALHDPGQHCLTQTQSFPMPNRNNAQVFLGTMVDSNAEEPRNMNDPEVMGNSVENVGLAGGRPLNAALVGYGGHLGPNGIGMFPPTSLSCLPSPFDPSHGSPSFSLATATVLNRKRRQEQRERDRKDKDAPKSCSSSATVMCAQASSNSGDPNEESEAKKAKTIPEEKKDEAYWERRRKNNEAAKRSRDARRQKEEEIALRATYLEQENLKLRAEIAVLKNETAKLHCLLLNRPMHTL